MRSNLAAIDWAKVGRWIERRVGQVKAVEFVARSPLAGGEVSNTVERLDVAVRPSGQQQQIVALVYKRTTSAELKTLQALKDLSPVASAVPVLIDGGVDGYGAWVLTPFFPGTHPPDHRAVPATVFESLACVHAHFRSRTQELPGLDTVDATYWRRLCLDAALPGVAAAQGRHPHPTLDRANRLLDAWVADTRIVQALTVLPGTLVHGDVHAGNVLVESERSVLIDWGNARVGPAMLDIANCAPPTSANHRAYLAAWKRITGTPLDPALADIGYQWAVVQVNVQYLGWAAQHLSSERVEGMLDRAEVAVNSLGEALGV